MRSEKAEAHERNSDGPRRSREKVTLATGENQLLTITGSSLFAEFSLETEKISFRASSFVVGKIFGKIWFK